MYTCNYSRNQNAIKAREFTPDNNSAEWIDERSSRYHTNCSWELADFQHADWSYSQTESTYYNNALWPIDSYNYDNLDRYNNPPSDYMLLAASPFGLNSDGMSFTDEWYNFSTRP